jgi:hypothetical protein
MTFLPSVIRAEYRGGFRIHLTFNDLSERTVDFRPWLEGPVFEALKDPAYFREFFVDGGTVVWPNGADIAPETLYEAANSVRTRGRRPERALRSQGSGGRATASARVKPAKARVRHRRVRHRGVR